MIQLRPLRHPTKGLIQDSIKLIAQSLHQHHRYGHCLDWEFPAVEGQEDLKTGIDLLHSMLREGQVTVFGTALSPYTQATKFCLDKAMVPYREVHLDTEGHEHSRHEQIRIALKDLLKDEGIDSSMPVVFVGYDYLGSLDELRELYSKGILDEIAQEARSL